MKLRKSRGFSLMEMMIVVALGLTMASITFMAFMPLFQKNHIDQAYDITLSALRTYRNTAIAQGGRFILVFCSAAAPPTCTAPETITVQGWGYVPPPGVSPAPVNVSTINLPQDVKFTTLGKFPNPGPDSFGTGAVAIFFNACDVVEAGLPCVVFYPDGSAQDDAGNYNNGVVYLNQNNVVLNSRAIDIWGTTGRIRGWRLYPTAPAATTYTWAQQ